MAFTAGASARCCIGLLNAAAYADSFSLSSETAMKEVTVFDQGADGRARKFVPGLEQATFTTAGPLDVDATANGQFDAIADIKAQTSPTSTAVSYSPLGWTVGNAGVVLVETYASNLTTSTPIDGRAEWSYAAQVTGQADLNGVALTSLAAVTADANGTSVDNGAATSNGGVIHLHVTAYSGFTSVSAIFEHSTDNSAWSTKDTFTSVTAVGSERRVISGTINRYTRIRWDVTGTGSITAVAAVARR
jgi:hypothetical protein